MHHAMNNAMINQRMNREPRNEPRNEQPLERLSAPSCARSSTKCAPLTASSASSPATNPATLRDRTPPPPPPSPPPPPPPPAPTPPPLLQNKRLSLFAIARSVAAHYAEGSGSSGLPTDRHGRSCTRTKCTPPLRRRSPSGGTAKYPQSAISRPKLENCDRTLLSVDHEPENSDGTPRLMADHLACVLCVSVCCVSVLCVVCYVCL